MNVIEHYDKLIDENNDPVIEIGIGIGRTAVKVII